MKAARVVLVGLALVFGAPLAAGLDAGGGASAQVPRHNCTACHNLHGAGFTQLQDYAISEDLCMSCHGSTGVEPDSILRDGIWVTIPKDVAVHGGPKHLFGPAQDSIPTSCWDCHNHEAEASGNLTLIQANMPAPDTTTGEYTNPARTVVFTSRGTDAGQPAAKSFADGDLTYDGVCEVCHTRTSNHGNGDPGDASNHGHNAGRTCTGCHEHGSGFAGGGPCRDCHNTAQDNGDGLPTWQTGRREILSELSRSSHHIAWVDSVKVVDCQTCHEQSRHTQGTVRLWNVDQPGDTAAAIKLLGDPVTTAAEAAKLEPFCLACHDPAGAGPSQPFTDGNTPPLVDATVWTAASHKAIGSFTCFDCHAGHGSQKRKLLQRPTLPASAGVTPPDSLEEQEGFCFDCHDGTPAVNIQEDFSAPILWVTASTGINNNGNLNDRHDIQFTAQDRSGAKIECVNCHNPHTAKQGNALDLLKADPDPTDGRIPGDAVNPVMASADSLSQWCMDCHDGGFAPGVVDQTTPIVDIRTNWLNIDQHGAANTTSENLRVGTGWDVLGGQAAGAIVPCVACHAPHTGERANRNHFQLKDTVRATNGTPIFGDNGFTYNVTLLGRQPDDVRGYFWCNTCHTGSMANNKVCFDCHAHGDGRL
jgi:predicted CXXCH cytochrome family protein